MNYIIVDLEATCWQGKRLGKNETIEIGAVLVNEHKEIISEFKQFIKPSMHPTLSEFCTELTSIQQSDIDHAPRFPEAIESFLEWCKQGGQDYVLCSWGRYDKNQFESDCILHEMDTQWTQKHISLKHQYTDINHLKRHVGMKGALWKEDFTLEGTHHRGIDDARNITKVFLRYFDKWVY